MKIETRCNNRQQSATSCNNLQQSATHRMFKHAESARKLSSSESLMHRSVLQCVAVCCSVLQSWTIQPCRFFRLSPRLLPPMNRRSFFAKEPSTRDYVLQKRPIILRILLSSLSESTPANEDNALQNKATNWNTLQHAHAASHQQLCGIPTKPIPPCPSLLPGCREEAIDAYYSDSWKRL